MLLARSTAFGFRGGRSRVFELFGEAELDRVRCSRTPSNPGAERRVAAGARAQCALALGLSTQASSTSVERQCGAAACGVAVETCDDAVVGRGHAKGPQACWKSRCALQLRRARDEPVVVKKCVRAMRSRWARAPFANPRAAFRSYELDAEPAWGSSDLLRQAARRP